ncbi:hypothetical protein [Arthrobacter sp. Z1-9]
MVAGAVVDGVADGVSDADGDADVVPGLAELVSGDVVGCACGSLGPHPLSISAAPAAVVMTNPCEIL